jgi:tRNA pseudouridine32 synthase/23S rRNA pseudouridine746 synthase
LTTLSDDALAPTRSIVALPGDVSAWPTLLDFFAAKFPHVSRETWLKRFEFHQIQYADSPAATKPPISEAQARSAGSTRVSNNVGTNATAVAEPAREKDLVARATERPRAHTKLSYARAVENEPPIPFAESIVYRDNLIVVADKPHFLPVVPSGAYVNETLLTRLKLKTGIATLAPAHRIDRETAGLVLFTIRPETRGAYQQLFRDRCVEKVYEAIAPFRESLRLPVTYRSRLERSRVQFMQAETVAGDVNAETIIELDERFDGVNASLARYRLTPRTGARHQLRAQLAALGIPIVNDAIYPELRPVMRADFSRPLQLLAKTLAFTDPITHQRYRFESALSLGCSCM